MKNPLSDKVQSLKPSGIRKFFDLVEEMPDAISLGVGEPDFDTPWNIREAGIHALNSGKTFYTANSGIKPLRKAISDYTKRKCSLSYDPDREIVVTVGGSEAIDIALRAVINPGDEVIYIEPCYVSYMPCIVLAGGEPVAIKVLEKNEFRLTPGELRAAITDKTKAIILPYPSNPTGAVMGEADLETIKDILIENDIIVISDEIYSELTYGEKHVSIASLEGMRERTVVINGFSKTFAMTGWRVGYATGPELILGQMLKIHQYAIMCAPTVSQYAAIEALENSDGETEKMRLEYDRRRRYLLSAFSEMGLPCFEPLGAFYTFPNISKFGLSSEDFATGFLKSQKVAVIPGTAFGESGEGFVRICYAYSIKELREAMNRMGKFISSL
ncbi:MAG: aminotransferase class I/II-fold pyridoxal phosphate-dependent enzyme [Oscillospiraceae bacterium]|nr:aminotransferase class I/II-fold pyridoxal phosphate-dependent enzyme [Oscillospiraceae bacterium]